jgi:hypothetical protein
MEFILRKKYIFAIMLIFVEDIYGPIVHFSPTNKINTPAYRH